MTISKLSLYNNALALVGERKLSSDTEDTESRHVLDTVYDQDARAYCLELVKPKFALLTAKLATPSTPTNHDLNFQYTFPSDYISIYSVFSDADLDIEIDRYIIENDTIACDISPNIYLRYIQLPSDFTDWTPSFAAVVSAYLATQIAPRFSPQKLQGLEDLFIGRVESTSAMEGVKTIEPRPDKATVTLDDDQLEVYNLAAALLGRQKIVSNVDDSKHRVAFDTALDAGAVNYLLSLTKPKFATLTVGLSDSGATTAHSFTGSFDFPADYLNIVEVHSETAMDEPVSNYIIEGRQLFANFTSIRLRYITSLATTSEWTPEFKQLLAAYLANQTKDQFLPDGQERQQQLSELYDTRLQFVAGIENVKEVNPRPQRITFSLTDDYREVYNAAFALMGLDQIVTDNDDSERRVTLDAIINSDAVEYLYDLTKPKFASETSQLTSSSPSTQHGFDNVFNLPSSYLSIIELHADEELDEPINRYLIEDRTIATNYSTIYLRFTSSNITTGDWTPGFKKLLAAYLAEQAKDRLVDSSKALADLTVIYNERLQAFIATESIKEVTPRPQRSTFTLTDDYRAVYNGAFNLLGLNQIVSNDDDSERRAALDTVINSGAVNYLLDLVKPKFAMETNKLTDSTLSTQHDFDNVFNLPSDYLCIVELHSDARLDDPINRYLIEARTIATDYDTIYLRFVTDSRPTSDWTPSFKQLLSAYLADQVKMRFVESDTGLKSVRAEFDTRLQLTADKEGYKEPEKRSTRSTATLTNTLRAIYNDALFIIGKDEIVSNDDDSDRRSKIDVVMGTGLVATVLEETTWTFAITSNKLFADPGLEPDWGFKKVYTKPLEMYRIDGIFSDDYFNFPLKEYSEEGDKIFCDLDEIWLQYVNTSFLTNPDSWPQYFKNVIAAEIAVRIAPSLDGDLNNATSQREKRGREADSTDAMRGPPQEIKQGKWVRSRSSYRRQNSTQRP